MYNGQVMLHSAVWNYKCMRQVMNKFVNLLSAAMQGAAGTFQMLQEQVFAHLQTAPTPDLSAECTTALVQLMLAQAQECFCIKAVKGGH